MGSNLGAARPRRVQLMKGVRSNPNELSGGPLLQLAHNPLASAAR